MKLGFVRALWVGGGGQYGGRGEGGKEGGRIKGA